MVADLVAVQTRTSAPREGNKVEVLEGKFRSLKLSFVPKKKTSFYMSHVFPDPFSKIFVSSPTLLSSNQNFGRNANGSFRCNWKHCFNRTMSFHFLLMIPLIMSVSFCKYKALIACVAAAPSTHRLDHWYSSSSLRIAHVRYMKILTWLRGFLVIIFIFGLVFFVLKSLLEIARQWSHEKFAILTPKPRSHVRIFIYRTRAISAQKLLCTNSQTLYTAVSYFPFNQSKLSTLRLLKKTVKPVKPTKSSTWPYLNEILVHFTNEIKTKGYDVFGVCDSPAKKE